MEEKFAIGVDVGATKLAFGLINQHGELITDWQSPTAANRGHAAVLEDITAGIRKMHSMTPVPVDGIGIGIPGQVIPHTGMVYNAVNLGWKEINLTREISTRLPLNLPIRIMKDADASLLGECSYGSARGQRNVFYVCVGSGLGGSFMSDGRLVRGENGTAAGIGHIQLQDAERLCSCGLRGCAETLVSGPGLIAETLSLHRQGQYKTGMSVNHLIAPQIIAAAQSGDPLACHALQNLAKGLGRVLAMCISITNPAVIILAGGLLLAAYDLIVPQAIAAMQQHSLPHCYQDIRILASSLSSSAIGAASLVWYEEEKLKKGGDNP